MTNTQTSEERLREMLTELAYCVTDEWRVHPWTQELADKTEAVKDAIVAASAAREEQIKRLRSALNDYMVLFGQALEAHGIPFNPGQQAAHDQARAALKETDQ
jgi:hypothetical protein